MNSKNITKQFYYDERDKRTAYAAKKVLGIIGSYIIPGSVVDIGGGVGTWLKTSQDLFGIKDSDICLYEGGYVSDYLVVSNECFKKSDLEEHFENDKSFDLAISLEVAEHLSEKRAASFVSDIVGMSDLVLFSAAIPFQGGKGHINERKMEYWINLFKEHEYIPFDIVRPIIQYDDNIDYWYKQNILVFCKKNSTSFEKIMSNYNVLPPLSMVSYDLFAEYVRRMFKIPFYSLVQRIKKSYIWKEWLKTKGATDIY